jgi:DNA-binding transcriptional LysR family regulator
MGGADDRGPMVPRQPGHTDSVLAQLQTAEADIQAIAGVRRGTLRVSSFPTAYATIMPPTIREFRHRHPGVELTLTETDPRAGLAGLKAGELDVALVYEYDFVPLAPDDAVELVHLLDDPINALLPRSHPAAKKASVRLIDLADDAWITSTGRSACHAFVRRACNAAGFEPAVSMESNDHGVWQGLVAAGVGVALASEISVPAPGPRIAVRPIRPKQLRRRIFAAHRIGAARSPAVAAMLSILLAETARRARPRPALVAG